MQSNPGLQSALDLHVALTHVPIGSAHRQRSPADEKQSLSVVQPGVQSQEKEPESTLQKFWGAEQFESVAHD
jgi:hypothetical protein